MLKPIITNRLKKITIGVSASLLLLGGVAYAHGRYHPVCIPGLNIVTENEDTDKCKVDKCPNIEGFQKKVPEGLIKDANGDCVEPSVEPSPPAPEPSPTPEPTPTIIQPATTPPATPFIGK